MRVQIVQPDDASAAARLARCLVEGLPYAEGLVQRPTRKGRWDIVYYADYGLFLRGARLGLFPRRPGNARLCGGWFERRDDDRFERVAKRLDFCVTPYSRYRDYLRDSLARDAHLIPPGVDTQLFCPKLQVGFSSHRRPRTRHGDPALAAVRKLPFVQLVELSQPAERQPAHPQDPEPELAVLYRSLDFVLITPSAGTAPLCLHEALASGKEVIAAHTSMASDLAGLPGVHLYHDTEELFVFLEAKHEERMRIRRAVEDDTVEHFVQQHDALFRGLLRKHAR